MTACWIVADVFDGLATLEDGTVDLVVTSPPFLALRSYLPADHPDKSKEIGSEPTPAAFLDVLLAVTAELRRVLAPHGSIAIELGDTYAGSGGAGGDYGDGGLRQGQNGYTGSARRDRIPVPRQWSGGNGWPLAKSKTLIPELYRIALAYGINPLTGQESPAGRWRIRNVVTWCRPNPPVGALGDKWRPATSDVVIACVSDKRYWDDIATRTPWVDSSLKTGGTTTKAAGVGNGRGQLDADRWAANLSDKRDTKGGAPLLDWWSITAGGYPGSHYAVFPPALVEPLVKAMAPPKVCRTCGEPSRRMVGETEYVNSRTGKPVTTLHFRDGQHIDGQGNTVNSSGKGDKAAIAISPTLGWSDCGHDNWRPSLILDCFAGSGTTLSVATGHGHNAVGIDLDERNADLAEQRIGPLMFDRVLISDLPTKET